MKFEKSNHYSENDILRMQQDAIGRVREMQRRAQKTIDDTNTAQRDLANNRRHEAGERQHSEAVSLSAQPSPEFAFASPGESVIEHAPRRSNPIGSIIKNLNLDSEDLLLIALIILLIREDADISLIVALVYLLL